jgi:hypothetical protein
LCIIAVAFSLAACNLIPDTDDINDPPSNTTPDDNQNTNQGDDEDKVITANTVTNIKFDDEKDILSFDNVGQNGYQIIYKINGKQTKLNVKAGDEGVTVTGGRLNVSLKDLPAITMDVNVMALGNGSNIKDGSYATASVTNTVKTEDDNGGEETKTPTEVQLAAPKLSFGEEDGIRFLYISEVDNATSYTVEFDVNGKYGSQDFSANKEGNGFWDDENKRYEVPLGLTGEKAIVNAFAVANGGTGEDGTIYRTSSLAVADTQFEATQNQDDENKTPGENDENKVSYDDVKGALEEKLKEAAEKIDKGHYGNANIEVLSVNMATGEVLFTNSADGRGIFHIMIGEFTGCGSMEAVNGKIKNSNVNYDNVRAVISPDEQTVTNAYLDELFSRNIAAVEWYKGHEAEIKAFNEYERGDVVRAYSSITHQGINGYGVTFIIQFRDKQFSLVVFIYNSSWLK